MVAQRDYQEGDADHRGHRGGVGEEDSSDLWQASQDDCVLFGRGSWCRLGSEVRGLRL